MTVSEIEAYVLNEISKVAPKVDEEDVKNIIREYLAENPFPVLSVNDQVGNIVLSAEDVGAEPSGTSELKVSEHNTDIEAHNDIRLLLEDLITQINSFLDVDDTTRDQLSELLSDIDANKSSIELITTNKVNITDIINNLTTNVANKPLSAAQGVVLKNLIDTLQTAISTIKVPTKTSELTDDVGFAKQSEVDSLSESVANKLDIGQLSNAIDGALQTAKESGVFDGKDGERGASILHVTSPMYTGSFTYESVRYPHRKAISVIEEEAGQTPKVGDFLLYNSALWPISLILDDTAYMQTNLSIKGATGERGNSILKVTTTPTSGSTTINSVSYNYKISVANVKNQSGTTPKVGDTILCGYYLYKVEYIYNSYAYSKTRASIRGATGDPGTDANVTATNINAALGYTPADQSEVARQGEEIAGLKALLVDGNEVAY